MSLRCAYTEADCRRTPRPNFARLFGLHPMEKIMKQSSLFAFALLSTVLIPAVQQIHAASQTIDGIVSDTMCGKKAYDCRQDGCRVYSGMHEEQGQLRAGGRYEGLYAGGQAAVHRLVCGQARPRRGRAQRQHPHAHVDPWNVIDKTCRGRTAGLICRAKDGGRRRAGSPGAPFAVPIGVLECADGRLRLQMLPL